MKRKRLYRLRQSKLSHFDKRLLKQPVLFGIIRTNDLCTVLQRMCIRNIKNTVFKYSSTVWKCLICTIITAWVTTEMFVNITTRTVNIDVIMSSTYKIHKHNVNVHKSYLKSYILHLKVPSQVSVHIWFE